jgi:hypothetical protein
MARPLASRSVLPADASELEEGIEGNLQRTDVALDLGEKEPALQCGKKGHGKGVGPHPGRELPGAVQGSHSLADGSRPPPESGGDLSAGFGVALGELAAE